MFWAKAPNQQKKSVRSVSGRTVAAVPETKGLDDAVGECDTQDVSG